MLASALQQDAEGGGRGWGGAGNSGGPCLSGTAGRGPFVEAPCSAGAEQAAGSVCSCGDITDRTIKNSKAGDAFT